MVHQKKPVICSGCGEEVDMNEERWRVVKKIEGVDVEFNYCSADCLPQVAPQVGEITE